MGILTENKGINVHLINCTVLERFTNFPELWYELTWDTKNTNYLQTARISLTVQNKIGSFNKITNCIAKSSSNIVDIKINKREEDFFYMDVDVQVTDSKHFNDLLVSLKLEDAIYKVREFKINKILEIYKKQIPCKKVILFCHQACIVLYIYNLQ